MKQKLALALHGGAGTLVKGKMTPELEVRYKKSLEEALHAGYGVLEQGGSAIDAVVTATKTLEDSPLFNAGKGSVFTAEGKHEMDAAIMDGESLEAGAVSLVSGVKNPIELARVVMTQSEHVFLAGKGAMEFARLHKLETADEEYFYDEYRYKQWQRIKDSDSFQLDHTPDKDEKFGTVGAVACDHKGNLAAATSTGGMTNKKYGRIGDSPVIGAGTYANNATCAVSCTGSGEYFLRAVTAYDLSSLIEHRGMGISEAADEVVHKRLMALDGDGGLIAVDRFGNTAMPFNTKGMYRASLNSDGDKVVAIYKD